VTKGWGPRFLPTGRLTFQLAGAGRLVTTDAGGSDRREFPRRNGRSWAPAWSPDGRALDFMLRQRDERAARRSCPSIPAVPFRCDVEAAPRGAPLRVARPRTARPAVVRVVRGAWRRRSDPRRSVPVAKHSKGSACAGALSNGLGCCGLSGQSKRGVRSTRPRAAAPRPPEESPPGTMFALHPRTICPRQRARGARGRDAFMAWQEL
jgi:hypothetical protein